MVKRDDIAQCLSDEIDAQQYTDMLPSENELAERFGVSRLTVRAALDQLKNDGKIYAEQGRGWFVRPDNRIAFPLLQLDPDGRARVSSDIWKEWTTEHNLHGSSSAIDVSQETPPDHVRDFLELSPGDQCVRRIRIRNLDVQPVMISTVYFPLWAVDGTWLANGDDADPGDVSPLGLLRRLGLGPVHEYAIVGARMPTYDEETILRLGRGVPVLTNYRTSRTDTGTPVRCTIDILASDRFYLAVDQRHLPEES